MKVLSVNAHLIKKKISKRVNQLRNNAESGSTKNLKETQGEGKERWWAEGEHDQAGRTQEAVWYRADRAGQERPQLVPRELSSYQERWLFCEAEQKWVTSITP